MLTQIDMIAQPVALGLQPAGTLTPPALRFLARLLDAANKAKEILRPFVKLTLHQGAAAGHCFRDADPFAHDARPRFGAVQGLREKAIQLARPVDLRLDVRVVVDIPEHIEIQPVHLHRQAQIGIAGE
jgi:hypothetical protein